MISSKKGNTMSEFFLALFVIYTVVVFYLVYRMPSNPRCRRRPDQHSYSDTAYLTTWPNPDGGSSGDYGGSVGGWDGGSSGGDCGGGDGGCS
jgi:hypothetical protein